MAFKIVRYPIKLKILTLKLLYFSNFTNIKSIDETWYKRAVEEYVNQKDTFIYSVPFEIIGKSGIV